MNCDGLIPYAWRTGYRKPLHTKFIWENIPNPDLFIAKALPLTQHIVLGTGVTCLPNHEPFRIAHRIA